MLPTIKSLWIGGDLSRLERVCLASFLAQGHKVQLYVYDEVGNVPNGVELKDANSILGREHIFQYGKATGAGKGSYAGFANYFRYKMLLLSSNSYWVDADVICLKPFPQVDGLIVGIESDNFLNNAVIGVEQEGHLLFEELCSYCDNPFKINNWDNWKIVLKKLYGRIYGNSSLDYLPWGQTGPKALTGFVNQLGLNHFAVNKQFFYPISPDDWKEIFISSEAEIKELSDSYGIHLWNEYLRRNGIEKNSKMDPSSLYEKLISHYSLEDY